MSPLVNNSKRYPTRTSFKGTLPPDLSHILLRRKDRLRQRLVSSEVAFDTLPDIHKLFANLSNKTYMTSFSVFDFTNIAAYPNQTIKFKDIREFLVFFGSDAISIADHWEGMERCFILSDTSHLDVKLKAFASCLTHDVVEWFKSSPAGSVDTYAYSKKKLFDRWKEKKDPIMLNNALMTMKISENETIEEF